MEYLIDNNIDFHLHTPVHSAVLGFHLFVEDTKYDIVRNYLENNEDIA